MAGYKMCSSATLITGRPRLWPGCGRKGRVEGCHLLIALLHRQTLPARPPLIYLPDAMLKSAVIYS